MTIRIIKHEAVPETGSFEVRYSDGRPSVYFYWEDVPGRTAIRTQEAKAETLSGASRNNSPRLA